MDQDRCFICKVPLSGKIKIESHFNCPKHEQAFFTCDNIDHNLDICLFCSSPSDPKPLQTSNDSQLQTSHESQPIALQAPPASRHCFLSFSSNDAQLNAFTVITIDETQESDIFAVTPKDPQYQFWVGEYAGVAQLSPREFLVTGGYADAEDGGPEVSDECFLIRFEPIGLVYTYTVEDLPSKLLTARYTHKAFAAGDSQFLVAGGLDLKRNFLRSCEVYCKGEWRKGPELNRARSQASGYSAGGFLYVFGGFSSQKVQETSFERIEEKGLGKWEVLQVKAEGLALTGSLCLGYKGGALIVGGSDGNKASRWIVYWDVEKGETVKRSESLEYERVNAAGVFEKSQLLVLGGERNEEVRVELVGIGKVSKTETLIEPKEDQRIFHFNQPGYAWFYLK